MASAEQFNGSEVATQVPPSDLTEHTSSVVPVDGPPSSVPKGDVFKKSMLNGMDASKNEVEGMESDIDLTTKPEISEKESQETEETSSEDTISEAAKFDIVISQQAEGDTTNHGSNTVDVDGAEPIELVEKDQLSTESDLAEHSSASATHTVISSETPEPTLLPHQEESDSLVENADDAQTTASVRVNVQSEEPYQDTSREAQNTTSEADALLGDDNQASTDLPVGPRSSGQMSFVGENPAGSVSASDEVPLGSTVADGRSTVASGTTADQSLVVDAGSLATMSADQEQCVEGNDPDPEMDETLVADVGNLQIAGDQHQSIEENKFPLDAGAPRVDPANGANLDTESEIRVHQSVPVSPTDDLEPTINVAALKEDVPVETEASIVADTSAIPAASGTMADDSLVLDAGSLVTTSVDREESVVVNDSGPEIGGTLVLDVDNLQIAEVGGTKSTVDVSAHQGDLSQPTDDANPNTESETQVIQSNPVPPTTDSEATIDVAVSNDSKPEGELVEYQVEVIPELRLPVVEKEGETMVGDEDISAVSALDASLLVDTLPAAPHATVSDVDAQENDPIDSESVTGERGDSSLPAYNETSAQTPTAPVVEKEGETMVGDEDISAVSALDGSSLADTLPAAPDATVSDVDAQENDPIDSKSVTGEQGDSSLPAYNETSAQIPTAADNNVSGPTEEFDPASTTGGQGNSVGSTDSGIPDGRQGEPVEQAEEKVDVRESKAEGELKEDVGFGALGSPPESEVVALPAAPDTVVAHEDVETVEAAQGHAGSPPDGEVTEEISNEPIEQQADLNTVLEGTVTVDIMSPQPGEEIKSVDEVSADVIEDPTGDEGSTTNDIEQLNTSVMVAEVLLESETSTEPSTDIVPDETQISDKDEIAASENIAVTQSSGAEECTPTTETPEVVQESNTVTNVTNDEVTGDVHTTQNVQDDAPEGSTQLDTEPSSTSLAAELSESQSKEIKASESTESATTTEKASDVPVAESSVGQQFPTDTEERNDEDVTSNTRATVEEDASSLPQGSNTFIGTPEGETTASAEPAAETGNDLEVAEDKTTETDEIREKNFDTVSSHKENKLTTDATPVSDTVETVVQSTPASLISDVTQNQIDEAAPEKVSPNGGMDDTAGDEQKTRVEEDVSPSAAVDETEAADESTQIVEGGGGASSTYEDVEVQGLSSTGTASHLKVAEEIERPKSPWTPSYSVTNQGPDLTAEEEIPEIESISEAKSEPKPVVESAQAANDIPSVNVVAPIVLPVEGIPLEDKLAQRDDEPPRPKSPWTPSYSVSRQGSPTPPVVEEELKQEETRTGDVATSAEDLPVVTLQEESTSEDVQEHIETSELPDSQAVPKQVNAHSQNRASSDAPTQSNGLAQEPIIDAKGPGIPTIEHQRELVEAKEFTGAASVSDETTSKAPDSIEESSAPAHPASPWAQSYSVSVQGEPLPPSRELPIGSVVERQIQTIQPEEEKELPNQDLDKFSAPALPSQHDFVTSTTNKEETSTGDDMADIADVSSPDVLATSDQMKVPPEQVGKSLDALQSQVESVTSKTNVVPDNVKSVSQEKDEPHVADEPKSEVGDVLYVVPDNVKPVSQEKDEPHVVDEPKSEVGDVLSSKTFETTNVKEPLPELEIPAAAPDSKSLWTPSYSVTEQGPDTSEDVDIASAPSQSETDVDTLSAPAPAAADSKLHSLIIDTSSTSAENTPRRPRSPWTPSYSIMRQGVGSTDAVNHDAELAKLEQLPVSVAQNMEEPRDVQQDNPRESDQGSEAFPTSASHGEEGSLTSLDTVTGSRDAPSSPTGRSRLESTASSLFFPGGWFSKAPPGRASLDNARGEFAVASKQTSSSPVEPTPEVPEEALAASTPTDATNEETAPKKEGKEKRSKWCMIM